MTPKQLIKHLQDILEVHPEAAEHEIFAGSDSENVTFRIACIRYDKRRKRLELDGV